MKEDLGHKEVEVRTVYVGFTLYKCTVLRNGEASDKSCNY